jgi:hypothetical protein
MARRRAVAAEGQADLFRAPEPVRVMPPPAPIPWLRSFGVFTGWPEERLIAWHHDFWKDLCGCDDDTVDAMARDCAARWRHAA